MTGDRRREEASAAREEKLDRALDHLLSAAPEPGVPAGLAARILAATSRIPQEPVPARQAPGLVRDPVRRSTRARPRSSFAGSWLERPRAVAATLAAAAVFGFAAGWAEPLMISETQSVDVAAMVFGIEPETEL